MVFVSNNSGNVISVFPLVDSEGFPGNERVIDHVLSERASKAVTVVGQGRPGRTTGKGNNAEGVESKKVLRLQQRVIEICNGTNHKPWVISITSLMENINGKVLTLCMPCRFCTSGLYRV